MTPTRTTTRCREDFEARDGHKCSGEQNHSYDGYTVTSRSSAIVSHETMFERDATTVQLKDRSAGLWLFQINGLRASSCQAIASKCSRSPRAWDTLMMVARLGFPSADSAL